jgi:hypothetical protein
MKKFKNLNYRFVAITFILIIIFSSCEKVVILDVKSASNKVVVQGNVFNGTGPYKIKLDYSVNYYSDNNFPTLTGALVNISDNVGSNEILADLGNGNYQTNSIQGVPGRTYNLKIIANGNTYSSSGTMANPTAIDSFLLKPSFDRLTLAPNGYRVVCKFTDPLGVGNYYRLVISSNDTAAIDSRNSRIVSDKYTDGQQISVTFRTKLIANDTVKIQLQSITKSIFDFYNTLTNAEGSVGASQFLSSLPANPTNNISNGGLGYFSVYSEIKQSMLVQ